MADLKRYQEKTHKSSARWNQNPEIETKASAMLGASVIFCDRAHLSKQAQGNRGNT